MCQTVRKGFLSILTDNEDAYFRHLNGIIDSVDELSTLEITKNPHSYHFRLAASVPMYNQMLLEELLKFHNLFHIKLDLSKSIKSSATIVFEINLDSN
jgi:hypothetical protein